MGVPVSSEWPQNRGKGAGVWRIEFEMFRFAKAWYCSLEYASRSALPAHWRCRRRCRSVAVGVALPLPLALASLGCVFEFFVVSMVETYPKKAEAVGRYVGRYVTMYEVGMRCGTSWPGQSRRGLVGCRVVWVTQDWAGPGLRGFWVDV